MADDWLSFVSSSVVSIPSDCNELSVCIAPAMPLLVSTSLSRSISFSTQESAYRGGGGWLQPGAYDFREDNHLAENECVPIPLLFGLW